MIRTAAPKLRMVAGPNGSGKSTLFHYLRRKFSFPTAGSPKQRIIYRAGSWTRSINVARSADIRDQSDRSLQKLLTGSATGPRSSHWPGAQ
jgi:ABC-type cobalamin/Fe3+-siderophores transport system ATPase subunit